MKFNPERQATINNYFFKIIKEITNEIIDLGLDECYKKYKGYPNIQAINKARKLIDKI